MSYVRPSDLSEALALLASKDLTVLAGGTDLYPATQKQSLGGDVLDVTGLGDLCGITRTDEGIRIGAATRWSEIIAADLPAACDALKLAAREVGSVQIQNSGTLGGNLCNASPAADGVPPLLILDAEVDLMSANGRRRISLAEFILGNRRTALGADELLEAIWLPSASLGGGSNFVKLGARKYLVISIAMVAVRILTKDGAVTQAAISVGSCSEVAHRVPRLEAALIGASLAEMRSLVSAEMFEDLSPIDDVRADAGYRCNAAVELVRRALGGVR